jgi:hypothetical protein
VPWLSAFERPAKPDGCGCLSAASSAAKLESTIKAKAQTTGAEGDQPAHAERINKQKKPQEENLLWPLFNVEVRL